MTFNMMFQSKKASKKVEAAKEPVLSNQPIICKNGLLSVSILIKPGAKQNNITGKYWMGKYCSCKKCI